MTTREPPITGAEIERIEALANPCHESGEWYRPEQMSQILDCVSDPANTADSELIATCDPGTILRLCAAARRGIGRDAAVNELRDAAGAMLDADSRVFYGAKLPIERLRTAYAALSAAQDDGKEETK